MILRLTQGVAVVLTTLLLIAADAPDPSSPSPQSSATPPAGAVVLFDGKDTSKWVAKESDKPCPWKVVDGALVAGGGDIDTAEKYEDYTLHVEFRTPIPKEGEKGQARGNSGVILDGKYEIQVLESSADPKPLKDGCGSVYNRKAADTNEAKKPMEWQSYDITFRAPRFDGEKKTDKARVSVIWNGKKVHDNVEIEGPTRSGDKEEKPGSGVIRLQDHHHPVEFRNIWIVPAKVAA